MSTAIASHTDRRAAPPEYAGVPSDQKRVKTRIGADARHDANGSTSGGPLATFLGLFSIGLGLWELSNPRGVAETSGVPYPGTLRAYGAREIASGLTILSGHTVGGLWSRVAGDALDIATAAAAFADTGGDADRRRKVVQTIAALLGVTVLDVVAATSHTAGH
ncbi:hypothetical protein [Gemmata sp.]|uniref:hypothetical protein n=1 Tax=Gemmata sp. TaxID=1914242 RepID=UPI003F6FAFF1